MTKKLIFISILLVVVVSGLLIGCGGTTTLTTTSTTTATAPAQITTTTKTTATTTTPTVAPINLTLTSFLPDIPPGANWHRLFIKYVGQFSNGAMTIQLMGPEAFPAMDAPSAVQKGSVDIASILSSFADGLVPGSSCCGRAEYSPMQLRDPSNPAHAAYQYWEDAFGKIGIYYFGASVSSYPQVQTVLYLGKEISTLADLKGLKIASTGGSNKAFIDSLGAVTIPVDFTDYFTSMERGTVDGYNIGIPGVEDFSLTPVTKAMLDEPFSSNGGMWLMNMNKYNSLSQAQKDVINRAAIQAEIDGADMFTQTVEQVKADLIAAGVKIIHLAPADSKAFYLAYRDNMWAADIARWPDIAPMLKQALVDPNFSRAQ
jgi:TRAP-type C4-dicarboxylate transport system substrate-binding protein